MIANVMQERPAAAPVALFLGVGTATIAAAWGFQLIGGYEPCKLCLEQRVPYYVALPLAGLGLAGYLLAWPRLFVTLLLVVAGAAMAYGAGLGVYQSGAEWGWWQGPSDCGGTGGTGPASVSDLMSQLQTIRIQSCTDPSWRMFGLSFAGWNAVVSAFLALVAFVGARTAFRASAA